MPKPKLICSIKAAPHIALLAHASGTRLSFNKMGKPIIDDNSMIAATWFTDHIDLPDPITSVFDQGISRAYTNFIIDNARARLNQINYSELLDEDSMQMLSEIYDIVQIIPDDDSYRRIALQRFFWLYDAKHPNYLFLDRGLRKHRHEETPRRLERYMMANGWDDWKDIRGFIRYCLADASPMMLSLREERNIKSSRGFPGFGYGDLFGKDCPAYEEFMLLIGQTPDRRKWIDTLVAIEMPRRFYLYGRYWDLDSI